VVVLLMPLSLSMYKDELDHSGGSDGGGGGGLAAWWQWQLWRRWCWTTIGGQEAAGNKSIDGRITACDGKSRWRTTRQQLLVIIITNSANTRVLAELVIMITNKSVYPRWIGANL
jgi:hypothetical protein